MERQQYDHERYLKNRDTILERNKKEYQNRKHKSLPLAKEIRKQNKLKAIAFLGGKCSSCGGIFHHSAYDFHHILPEKKEKAIGLLLWAAWDVIVQELTKCALLCANCHRIHHYGEKYGDS